MNGPGNDGRRATNRKQPGREPSPTWRSKNIALQIFSRTFGFRDRVPETFRPVLTGRRNRCHHRPGRFGS
ncbi:hypothetical protein RHRU231_570009 [Rhodococcus ruber]|uniref:Uncharacterized protein n=1 Tax=Rhodococcus ruber TaxID=1830 RepID=A0A098BMG6_9NOCA|nr:hypothetical protein RHRU231_570009 [Rhodococcus ruber]